MKENFMLNRIYTRAISAAVIASLTGCTSLQPDVSAVRSKAEKASNSEIERAEQIEPVVTSTAGAWLMGDAVEIEAPRSPILDRVVTYHPAKAVTLLDVAAYIQQVTGIKVEAIDLQAQSAASPSSASSASTAPGPMAGNQAKTQTSENPAAKAFMLSYEGDVGGLLDLATAKAGVWWKIDGGRLRYYQTETKTFYLPAMARVSSGSAAISASTGADQGGGGQGGGQGGGGGSGGQGGGQGGGGGSMSGGTNSSSAYTVNKWADISNAVQVVAAGAAVSVNPSLGSISVTGTPNQVRHVADWVKDQIDSMSQMVSITVRMYSVTVNGQDNYSWTPDVLFQGLKTQYGFSLSGKTGVAVPAGTTPFSFIGGVLTTATGSKAQYAGSQIAVQALSQLGHVDEILDRTVVTLNGEPAPVQIANQRGYVSGQTAPTAVPTGTVAPAPTLTTSTLTTGFTAMFLPRVSAGKVWLTMNITDSKLVSLDPVGRDTSIQNPNIDLQAQQNIVRLTPDDTLLLTGHKQETASGNNSGVGSPFNYLLGGGVGRSAEKKIIAIVVSAKVVKP